MKKGKFIVIDGTDGSGKATQTKLLIKKLKKEGFKVKMADFPQYGKKSAMMVEEYLNGKYGDADSVGPYQASVFYACDRYDASFKIRKWLNEGSVVISNRYVAANMGHQGGKIKNKKDRFKYFKWLYELEYEMFSIPKPDASLVLHVNAAVAQKLVDSKEKRAYIEKGKKRDIHENNITHLKNAEKVYLEIAKIFKKIYLIECTEDGQIMSREKIEGLIWKKISKILK